LGEEILVDTYNSSFQFGRSSARSTSQKNKRKEIHSGILFLGLGFQEFWLSSSVCLLQHQVVFCGSYLQFFLCGKKKTKQKTQHLNRQSSDEEVVVVSV
jgi:hypothetical protein